MDEFLANEARGLALYGGKRLRIHGIVGEVQSSTTGFRLMFSKRYNQITPAGCHFPKASAASLAALQPNDGVTVEGTVFGIYDTFKYLRIDDCLIP